MVAANFAQSLAHVLRHEGGYVDHPADPGGPTRYGITLATYRQHAKPGATAADVRAMSRTEAAAIYRVRYWNVLVCDELPAGLDYAVFDYGVNSGVARATRVLRRISGAPGAGSDVDAATLAAVRRHDAAALIASLCDERLAFLRRLKTWSVFGRGWSRRVSDVRAAALAMASGLSPSDAAVPAPGKGVAPVNRAAQRGTTGGAIVTGVAAAERANDAGASLAVLVTILAAAALLAAGAFLFWRWRAARAQTRILIPPKTGASA